jgi:C-terminal processing protease CtpA/Prc
MSIDLINQVFAGTPASGDLQRGDAIVLVQHRDASHLTQQEANEIIKNSGGSVSFTIRRFLYIYFYRYSSNLHL